jgi:hypothetical protein
VTVKRYCICLGPESQQIKSTLSHPFQRSIAMMVGSIFFLALHYSLPASAFSPTSISTHSYDQTSFISPSAKSNPSKLTATPQIEQEETIPSLAPPKFVPLLDQAYQTTLPKEADNTKNAHDPFRFEWGTWVDVDSISELMARVDEVRAAPGAFDRLWKAVEDDLNIGDEEQKMKGLTPIRFASGPKWDCILHVLPSNTQYEYRWPTGSWSILKALTGVVEVAMLKEDRDGKTTKRTKKDLRGGSDGKFGVGGGAAIGGADCVKYGKNVVVLYTILKFIKGISSGFKSNAWISDAISIPKLEDLCEATWGKVKEASYWKLS